MVMKKLLKLVCVMFSFLFLCVVLVGCAESEENSNVEKLSYISMRINPEIELVVNADSEVVGVNAINEDGETVLAELDLVGLTADEAGESFTSMAIELGFIDVDADNATVYILAEGESEEVTEELEEKLEKKINDLFDRKGIFGKVSHEDLEEYKELAEEWGVSLRDARMVSRILELYPEKTLEEVLELSLEERIELIKDDAKANGLPVKLRDEYKAAVNEVKKEYDELFALHKELKELELKLKDETLSEEELALVQEEYDAKKAEFDALNAEYEEKINALKAEQHDKVEEIKEELEQKAKALREDAKEEIQKHEEKILENKAYIEKQIQQWRDNNKAIRK